MQEEAGQLSRDFGRGRIDSLQAAGEQQHFGAFLGQLFQPQALRPFPGGVLRIPVRVSAAAETRHRLLVHRKAEAFLDEVFPQRHVHLMALRIHVELAGHIAEPAGGAGADDLRQLRVRLDAPFRQRERQDLFSGPGVAVKAVLAVGGTAVEKVGMADHGQGNHLAQVAAEALEHFVPEFPEPGQRHRVSLLLPADSYVV